MNEIINIFKMERLSMTEHLQTTLNKQIQLKLQNLLGTDEKILMYCEIQKFNEVNKCQQRIFLLTDRAIYNLKKSNMLKSFVSKLVSFNNPFTIQRIIPMNSIYGITISKQAKSTQFVLHINKQHDYRYRSSKKMSILKAICSAYKNFTGKKIPFFFKDTISLSDYCTTKIHLKSRINKKPKQQPIYIDEQNLQQYDQPKTKLELVYSSQGGDISFQQFNQLKNDEINPKVKYFTIKTINSNFQKILPYFQHKNKPFVTLPYYCYTTEGKTHLITPFMLGGNLQNILKNKGSFTQQISKFYISQLIIALEYFHNGGFMYRSLSLNKVLLSQNGYISIDGLDQCIKKKQNNNLEYQVIGQPSYMSPEMILCNGYGYEGDIWSLGVCLAYMLTGNNIFRGADDKTTLYNILSLKNIPFNNLPTFMKRVFIPNPQQRITLQQIKKDIWFQNINWNLIKQQKVKAVYIPQLNNLKEWLGQCPSILYLEQ